MERQYPPFGQIPGPVLAGVYAVRHTPHAALSLTNFEALPTGLLASLRTSTSDTDLFDGTYSFEAMSPSESTQLDIWLEVGRGDSRTQRSRIAANLVSGHRGQDQGVESRIYVLWFPVNLGNAEGPLTIRLSWPEAGIAHDEVRITQAEIREALALAYVSGSGQYG
jgi:hypothetical protein